MTDRPILFSAPMVRAILAGTKTQTRRAWPNQPPPGIPIGWTPNCCAGRYGKRGDRLWVRETWMPDAPRNGEWPDTAFYGCGMSPLSLIPECYRHPWHALHRATYDGCDLVGWKPSIHMPRWASRITLEITDVRVERLQDISEADAQAEGCDRLSDDEPGYVHRDEPDFKICPRCGGTRLYTAFSGSGGALPDTDCLECDTYVKRYRLLWERINGAGSWEANPWVWVVEFRRETT